MPKPVTPTDDLSIILGRIKVGAFMTVVGGMLVLTLASTLGDEAIRTVILGTLTILFVIGGGLMGLVSMHHISHTHLPESGEDELADMSLSSSELPIRRRTPARGFLGLFALSQDASHEGATPPNNDFRRTA